MLDGKEKPRELKSSRGFVVNPGGVLLSHTVPRAVPLALEGLTSEFGMGSGMTPPTLPPKTFRSSEMCHSDHWVGSHVLLPTPVSNYQRFTLEIWKSRTAD